MDANKRKCKKRNIIISPRITLKTQKKTLMPMGHEGNALTHTFIGWEISQEPHDLYLRC